MKLLSAILLILMAISSVKGQQDTTKVVSAIELVCMNTLFRGVDNPVRIVVSRCDQSDLDVTIDNGIIEGCNGEYIVRPLKVGEATITIKLDGKEIQRTNYVVKERFNYKAVLNGESNYRNYDIIDGGKISKIKFLSYNGIKIIAANTDFNAKYRVIKFSVCLCDGDFERCEVSHCEFFTEEQIKLIQNANNNSKLYIDDIYVVFYNKDGEITYIISPMNFTIIEH